MYIELIPRPEGQKLKMWRDFLNRAGLETDEDTTQTVLIWDDSQLIATGSRQANLLKCIAVDSARRGEDLAATVLTELRREAFHEGHRHLFLYTKPENKYLFSSLFFYPVAQTDKVLLMEDQKNGIRSFLESLPTWRSDGSTKSLPTWRSGGSTEGRPCIGAVVMNCNPFTLGHRYLIDTAAKECDHLYIFILSEDKSRFSAADRLEMVRLGTRDLPNVTVLPTGPYLISSATFPTYFLKERENAEQIHCLLDIEIFTRYFVPRFSITRRYVGTEPLSPMTNRYNEALKAYLPEKEIELRELPRLEISGLPIDNICAGGIPIDNTIPVSASAVRALIDAGQPEAIRPLVPQTTYEYLQANGLLSKI